MPSVRVKVVIQNPPLAMSLGSAVAGTVQFKSSAQIVLPWTALMATGTKPAVCGLWTRDQDGRIEAGHDRTVTRPKRC